MSEPLRTFESEVLRLHWLSITSECVHRHEWDVMLARRSVGFGEGWEEVLQRAQLAAGLARQARAAVEAGDFLAFGRAWNERVDVAKALGELVDRLTTVYGRSAWTDGTGGSADMGTGRGTFSSAVERQKALAHAKALEQAAERDHGLCCYAADQSEAPWSLVKQAERVRSMARTLLAAAAEGDSWGYVKMLNRLRPASIALGEQVTGMERALRRDLWASRSLQGHVPIWRMLAPAEQPPTVTM